MKETDLLREINRLNIKLGEPIPMRLPCPECGEFHIDEGEFATKAHHTHACQECGMVWRPAIVPTVGVKFLPGFRNAKPEEPASWSKSEKCKTCGTEVEFCAEDVYWVLTGFAIDCPACKVRTTVDVPEPVMEQAKARRK